MNHVVQLRYEGQTLQGKQRWHIVLAFTRALLIALGWAQDQCVAV